MTLAEVSTMNIQGIFAAGRNTIFAQPRTTYEEFLTSMPTYGRQRTPRCDTIETWQSAEANVTIKGISTSDQIKLNKL